MNLGLLNKIGVLLWLLAGEAALAQEPPQAPSARSESERGERLYKSGQYEEARKAFQAAYLLKQSPVFLYNIAQCHRMLKQHQEAIALYERALREEQLSVELRGKAHAYLAEERGHVATERAEQEQRQRQEAMRQMETQRPVHRLPWFWGVMAGAAAVAAAGVTLGVYFGAPPRDPPTDLGTFAAF